MTLFSGLSAFPVTPFNAHGQVDSAHLERIIQPLVTDDISSIGVLGSTGGYAYLTPAEREKAVQAAVVAAGSKPVLAGIGAVTTHEVLHNMKAAQDAGAQGLLLAPVSYLPLTRDDVTGLVEAVAGESDLPICLYHNPGTTKFNFTDDHIAQLSQIPTVMAVKNPPASQGDFQGQIERLRKDCSSGFSLGYSGDSFIAGALSTGCDAWYSVLAGTLPDIAIKIWNARSSGKELSAMNALLQPLWETFNAYGSIRVIYEIANKVGLGPVALPAPLLPLGDEACREIDAALALLDEIEV